MKPGLAFIRWLRGLHRGYKFAILLIAAWAPLVFPDNPLFTAVLMAVTTAAFFIATGRKAVVTANQPNAAREDANGKR
jgi:hypothetical protein